MCECDYPRVHVWIANNKNTCSIANNQISIISQTETQFPFATIHCVFVVPLRWPRHVEQQIYASVACAHGSGKKKIESVRF